MRRKIKCLCGVEVTTNTMKCHVRGKNCKLSDEQKSNIMLILKKKTECPVAWLKSDDLNAIGDNKWFLDAIFGSTSLDDWSFQSPRKQGLMTPKSLQKLSENRTGSKNPAVSKKIPKYNIEEIKTRAKDIVTEIVKSDTCGINQTMKILKKEFPNFVCMFSDTSYPKTKRGFSDHNHIFACLLDISVTELIKMAAKQRGKLIRKSQLSSEHFRNIASRIGSECMSKWRITKPQKKLFELIVSRYDSSAVLEYKVSLDGIFRSYDIFSPRINGLIEMHGRVWHDPNNTKEQLKEICAANVKNDSLKKSIAISVNKQYIVFWDDEADQWVNQLEEIYENQVGKKN